MNTELKSKPGDAEAFRTWWVHLDVETAQKFKIEIKLKLGWHSGLWYDRLHGRSKFTIAEKAIINQITGQDPFFTDQEADVQP